ncbi:hypothetical protein [Bradyrhizobium sp. WD16]|uniref:hypothetical protein n=1 Tax=Bradyrhizobium sp. WD16 TaxID=1521768 RepID=UPI0020A2F8E3|nr:hypothetical protein [Bradyrhizobium sp. WD16]
MFDLAQSKRPRARRVRAPDRFGFAATAALREQNQRFFRRLRHQVAPDSAAAVTQYLAGPAIDEMHLRAGEALDRFEPFAVAVIRPMSQRRLNLQPGPRALENDQLRHGVIFAEYRSKLLI